MLYEIAIWFENNPLPSPPEMLSWASIIIAIVLGVLKLWEIWRSRPKLDLEVIATNRYCRFWHEGEFPAGEPHPSDPTSQRMAEPGDCKSSFEVLEFAIRNNYKRDITIGRFQVAGWMYSDAQKPEMYGKKRDYRAFALLTKERINLETYRVIPAGGMFGIRIESWEEQNAGRPTYISNHLYYTVELAKRYTVEFNTDVGRMKRTIKLAAPEKDPYDYPFIYRWSDDLIGPMREAMSRDYPQGVRSPDHSERYPPWYSRLVTRFSSGIIGWVRKLRVAGSGPDRLLP